MTPTEFSFEALEAPVQLAPPATHAEADAVMAALARAESDADTLRAQAREQGLLEGREEALAALAPGVEALSQAVEAVRADQYARAERLERHAVDLALFLAEKVIGSALAVDPERVVEAVRGALRGLVERERVTVLVNPADLELVRAAIGGVVAAMGGIEHCDVQAERRVGRGGAVVRTPDGDVDASLDAKLERAREVVTAALGAA
jgi:flagellar assembly protein FliH